MERVITCRSNLRLRLRPTAAPPHSLRFASRACAYKEPELPAVANSAGRDYDSAHRYCSQTLALILSSSLITDTTRPSLMA